MTARPNTAAVAANKLRRSDEDLALMAFSPGVVAFAFHKVGFCVALAFMGIAGKV
jgi:hypothetical protein